MPTSETIRRKPLLTALTGGARPTDRVEIVEVSLPPGQESGLHRHPCPVVGYVARGTISFHIDGQPARNLNQGDAFFEPAGTRILRFDNASTSEPATFIAFYLLGPGEHELIEMLE
jgi:quercetin dioxygenase-like cupin family protein